MDSLSRSGASRNSQERARLPLLRTSESAQVPVTASVSDVGETKQSVEQTVVVRASTINADPRDSIQHKTDPSPGGASSTAPATPPSRPLRSGDGFRGQRRLRERNVTQVSPNRRQLKNRRRVPPTPPKMPAGFLWFGMDDDASNQPNASGLAHVSARETNVQQATVTMEVPDSSSPLERNASQASAVAMLNTDAWEMVSQFLSTHTLLSSLGVVCRELNQLINAAGSGCWKVLSLHQLPWALRDVHLPLLLPARFSHRFDQCTQLDLRGCDGVSSKSLVFLFRHCPAVESARLDGCVQLDDEAVCDLIRLCPKLRSLRMSRCHRITNKSLRFILEHGANVTQLDLSYTPITDEGATPVLEATQARPGRMPPLQLDGAAPSLPQDAAATDALVRGSTLRLRSLNLSGTRLTSSGVCSLLTLHGEGIKSLNLGALQIEDAVLECVALCCAQLTELSLISCTSLTDRAMDIIAGASWFHTLEFLSLERCVGVTDRGIRRLAVATPPPSRLTSLNLSYLSRLNDAAVSALVRNCRALEALYLAHCPVSSHFLQQLAPPSTSEHSKPGVVPLRLRVLDLQGSAIQDDGLRSLSPDLRELNLNGCHITDEGLVNVAALCHGLRSLSVRACSNVTDLGIKCVSVTCRKLRFLDMSRCLGVHDVALEHLASHCPELEHLNLSACNAFSPSAMKQLTMGCPNLHRFALVYSGVWAQ